MLNRLLGIWGLWFCGREGGGENEDGVVFGWRWIFSIVIVLSYDTWDVWEFEKENAGGTVITMVKPKRWLNIYGDRLRIIIRDYFSNTE